jgi:hypothetical protein
MNLHWHTRRWKAAPMSYAIDGRQYVAVVAGSTLIAFGLP